MFDVMTPDLIDIIDWYRYTVDDSYQKNSIFFQYTFYNQMGWDLPGYLKYPGTNGRMLAFCQSMKRF